jgi:hypothetical protein
VLLRRQVAALDSLRERDLLGCREQLVAPRPVHEQGQAVGRDEPGAVVEVDRRRRGDLDLACLELRPDPGELVVVELVLERKCLERALIDRAAILGVLEELVDRCFENGVQIFSLRRSAARSGAAPLEPLDSAAALHAALCTGVRRMTIGAHVDDELVARGSHDEAPPTRRAADGRKRALRVDVVQVNRLLREVAARDAARRHSIKRLQPRRYSIDAPIGSGAAATAAPLPRATAT